MNSRNNSSHNAKQQELVKRLEEIRKQRAAAEMKTSNQTTRQTTPDIFEEMSRSGRRNAGQQRQTSRNQPQRTQRKNIPVERPAEPVYRTETKSQEITQPIYTEHDRRTSRPAQSKKAVQSIKKEKKNSGQNLVSKLSTGENLAEAFILSEVLSKPIALRDRNR